MATPYTGPVHPSTDELTNRRYNRARSRIVDRWLLYADLELLTPKEKQDDRHFGLFPKNQEC
jgi:hypothetical protein